ncbi:hypothetical protein [Actinomadura madurae]|uniref:hypothetical protein n=1 Tax=Actinomadura madurae TaxID=1993 RepID=UPI0020D22453|nr:hypothetical protein [Actinomadura madurae]MCP9953736.1 hypothetical protein [Actinomadura madurae]MCP9970489.1 hypothetical protein [Actinomadura madurae]MCP9982971.1 hypothetical protein [Actinomadura madurae]MCQ0005479.1 hypothetical protein [Actinomadura madurae]MCQ0019205.1 hypothetical protein [Actinomadura madurae]
MSITEERPARRRPVPRKGPRKNPGKNKAARRSLGSALKRAAGLGWPVTLALAICLSALAVDGWAGRRSERSPAANRALVDKARTARVVADVSAKVERIFTYVHTDPAATERAASAVLTGRAIGDYRRLFGLVERNAPVMRLALTTKVTKAGLIKLTRDGTAVLLVMLDQTTTRDGKATGSPVAAQLIVTARDDHGWRISDLRAA